jgi:mannitol-1-phosphate 5-dehydrogenase
MKTKILIMGAGAIGRGYLPWVLDATKHEFIFIDSNQAIVDGLSRQGGYTTYRVKGDQYEEMHVKVHAAYTPVTFNLSEHRDAVACFFSVGPRNVIKAAMALRGSRIPLVLCENDPEAVRSVKQVIGHEEVYFAVPDVITSNTAPAHLLAKDPLSITTENGILYIAASLSQVSGQLTPLPEEELLRIQWTPKLYLHNTPHCIAAYLGALLGKTYVHEAMANLHAAELVEGAMTEMLQALKLKWDIPHDFLDWYAAKELARFRCPLLFDPVARVAREPLRKLEMHGRLIGAAQMCLMLGVLPQSILKGIVGALLFDDANDPDHHVSFMREAMDVASFNRYVLGLRPGEPLDLMVRDQIDLITTELQDMSSVQL